MAAQTDDAGLQAKFAPLAKALAEKEAEITQDLIDAQGAAVDIGGYFEPNDSLAEKAMRPSAAFNALIDQF